MKYLFIGAISLLSAACYGQAKKFAFKMGAEFEIPSKSDDLSFFGNEKDGIMNLAFKKDELTITRFDPKSLRQTSDKVIELTDATRNMNSETSISLATNYYWFHSDWDKGDRKEILTYDKIDVKGPTITESGKRIIETTKIEGIKVEKGWYNYKTEDKYTFDMDAGRSKLLITYGLRDEEKNEKKNYDKFGFWVFDENMNKLWSNEFVMPYKEAVMRYDDFTVDNQGSAYMLAKIYDSEKRKEIDKETKTPAYHYEVFKISRENNKLTPVVLQSDNFFIRDASILESSNHEIFLAGTYSKKGKGLGTDGIFLFQLDASGNLMKYKKGFYEFPVEELEKFESARKKKYIESRADYEASNIKVRNIVMGSDGSIFIACEEYHDEVIMHTSTTNFNSNMSSTSTRYTYNFYYDDIYATRISPAGEFEWLRKIQKNKLLRKVRENPFIHW